VPVPVDVWEGVTVIVLEGVVEGVPVRVPDRLTVDV
jgi:hypothetical protein